MLVMLTSITVINVILQQLLNYKSNECNMLFVITVVNINCDVKFIKVMNVIYYL